MNYAKVRLDRLEAAERTAARAAADCLVFRPGVILDDLRPGEDIATIEPRVAPESECGCGARDWRAGRCGYCGTTPRAEV